MRRTAPCDIKKNRFRGRVPVPLLELEPLPALKLVAWTGGNQKGKLCLLVSSGRKCSRSPFLPGGPFLMHSLATFKPDSSSTVDGAQLGVSSVSS